MIPPKGGFFCPLFVRRDAAPGKYVAVPIKKSAKNYLKNSQKIVDSVTPLRYIVFIESVTGSLPPRGFEDLLGEAVMLKVSYIDVSAITVPSAATAGVNMKGIQELAKAIIECDGLSRPIIVKAVGPTKYELVDGARELAAVIEAGKIDEDIEMIHAIVVKTDSEAQKIIKQRKLM